MNTMRCIAGVLAYLGQTSNQILGTFYNNNRIRFRFPGLIKIKFKYLQ